MESASPECRWRVLRRSHDQASPPGPPGLSAISDPYSDSALATARRHSARPGRSPRLTTRRSKRCSLSQRARSRCRTRTSKRDEGVVAASRAWCGGAEPVPAQAPRWAEDSLGHRFFAGVHLSRMRTAPCLATAEIPAATVIHADSAHWSVAAQALIRAVTFDGLGLDHPAVIRLLEILVPIAEAELAYNETFDRAVSVPGLDWDEDLPEFPGLDGPVFLLGTCALVDAFWAVVGDDSFGDVLGVLLPVLEDAVPGLDSQIVADALIGAFAVHYDCDQPGDGNLSESGGLLNFLPERTVVLASAI